MSAITLSQLSLPENLKTVTSNQLTNIKGGWIFSFGFSPTTVRNTTTLQNVYSGGHAPNLQNQVVATTGAVVNINSTIPLALPPAAPPPVQ